MRANYTPKQWAAAFLAKQNRSGGPESCWIWTGATAGSGSAYGVMSKDGKMRYAHILAWEQKNGPVPIGLCILHSCDTTLCVNEAHLSPGTRRQNTRDMLDRRRNKGYGAQKLSDDQVLEIYSLRRKVSHAELGRRFGVSEVMVGRIQNGKSWFYVTGHIKSKAIT